MMQDHQIMCALRTVYDKLIDGGHDPDSDYMCEFSLVIQEQPILHKVIYAVSTAMDGIADRYVHSR